MKRILLTCALALSACGALTGSDMPDVEDTKALRAAIVKLDPIALGSASTDTGLNGMGQPGSDRYLFVQRMMRWADEDSVRRMNVDYKPAPLPRSIAQAIAEQRRFEVEQEAKSAAERKARRQVLRREQAVAEEGFRRMMRRDEARERASEIETEQLLARQRAQAAENAVQLADCQKRSFEAQQKAPLDQQAAVYNSFNCDQYR